MKAHVRSTYSLRTPFAGDLISSIVVGVLVTVNIACTSVPLASPTADAAAKRFEAPPAELSRIYVARPGNRGGSVAYQVSVNGSIVGMLPIGSYLVTDVTPGQQTIVLATPPTAQRSISMIAESGRSHFVTIDNFAHVREQVEAEGKRFVRSSRRVDALARVP